MFEIGCLYVVNSDDTSHFHDLNPNNGIDFQKIYDANDEMYLDKNIGELFYLQNGTMLLFLGIKTYHTGRKYELAIFLYDNQIISPFYAAEQIFSSFEKLL